jgi:hypothetical protein
MIITPVTELDAINEILGAVGESPIDTLENVTDVDALNAQRILSVINRQEQARGWSFNIQKNYILNPDTTLNKIKWSDDFLYIKGSNGERYVKQGNYLKDIVNNTTYFDKAISVTIILLVPFDEMPEAMRRYIVAKAALSFTIRYFGDDSLVTLLTQDVMEAWQEMQEYEIDVNDFNMLEHENVLELNNR